MTTNSKSDPQQETAQSPLRRFFLAAGLWSIAACSMRDKTAAATSSPASAETVAIEEFGPDGTSTGVVQVAKIAKSDAEWRKQLSSAAYNVARREGTERPGSGEYASSHSDGLYHCICCETPLFDSRTKFESGTGWPSFYQPVSAKNVAKSSDRSLGMQRDEISCRRCDAHLGHVFDDGPRPTGLRYCMNSVALHFVARA